MNIVLHQFQASHFNEKARWALGYKALAHQRQSYLPGPHIPAIKKLSGQSQTPVLALDGKIISGSAAIIDALEEAYPTSNRLYPSDPELRAQALALQEKFDRELGPAVRTVVFAQLINHVGYLARMFARHKSALALFTYLATLPLVKPLIAKGNGADDPENVKRARNIVDGYLEDLANRTAAEDYLVGNEFSVADLTAAALLAPLVALDHPDMQRPQPVPASMQTMYDAYASQPALQWVKTMYQRHRSLEPQPNG